MTDDRPGRRISLRASLVALAILAAIVVAGIWTFAYGPGQRLLSPPGATVASFAGDGPQMTAPFSVRAGWAIHWESTGPFSFAIRGDRDFGTIINTGEPGSGITSPTGEGTYYLEVQAERSWTIRISQGD